MNSHTPFGEQFVADIWFKEEMPDVEEIIETIVQEYELNVVDRYKYHFKPGDTIVLVLSESHFVVHTYPELNYINIDIYSCTGKKMYKIKDYLNTIKDIKKMKIDHMQRGV